MVADNQDAPSRLSSRPTHISLNRRAELRASAGGRAEATSTAGARRGRARPGAGSHRGEAAGGAVHNYARLLHTRRRLIAPPAACEAVGGSQREASGGGARMRSVRARSSVWSNKRRTKAR